jgi:hypothetical protein
MILMATNKAHPDCLAQLPGMEGETARNEAKRL